jgi:nitric-oxide synthase
MTERFRSVTLAVLPPRQEGVDVDAAHAFLEQFHAETNPPYPLRRRLRRVRAEIERTGTYVHTEAEVEFGAKVAWRNAARCIGRLYWHGLHVRDRRAVHTPSAVADECAAHLRACTRGGRIRSTITVFAPDRPGQPGPRIVNDQLVRYAGHRTSSGAIRGDGGQVELTEHALALGWQPPEPPGRFDVLPLLISADGAAPEVHELPRNAVLEVAARTPGVRVVRRPPAAVARGARDQQHAAVDRRHHLPAAPFNGWYLGTEIGARNLADPERYDLLPVVAQRMGIAGGSERTLWRDRAVIELVRAVQHSFDVAGVTMSDHHEESRRFLKHVAKEERAGRGCPADWSWIVPPISGALTPVFHRYYDEPDPTMRPAYLPPADTLRSHPRR